MFKLNWCDFESGIWGITLFLTSQGRYATRLENTVVSVKSPVFFHRLKKENLNIVELHDNFLSKRCGKRPRLGLIKMVFSRRISSLSLGPTLRLRLRSVRRLRSSSRWSSPFRPDPSGLMRVQSWTGQRLCHLPWLLGDFFWTNIKPRHPPFQN